MCAKSAGGVRTSLVPIKSIKLNPSNPRIIKDEKFKKLVASLREFPKMLEIRPIVIDEKNVILGGNMRLKAAKELGLKEVHVVKVTGLTEDEKDEFTIRDNLNYGDWDWNAIRNEWDVEMVEAWGLEVKAQEPAEKAVGFSATSLTLKVKCKDMDEKKALAAKLIEDGYDVKMPS